MGDWVDWDADLRAELIEVQSGGSAFERVTAEDTADYSIVFAGDSERPETVRREDPIEAEQIDYQRYKVSFQEP